MWIARTGIPAAGVSRYVAVMLTEHAVRIHDSRGRCGANLIALPDLLYFA